MMKITVLDGHTLNPGDLLWEDLEKLGKAVIYPRTSPDELEERASGAEIILTNKTPLREDILKRLPGLKYIGVLATGYDVVDVEAAASLGIAVTNIPSYGTSSVAQMVFAHLLEFCQNVQNHSLSVRNGEWSSSPDFCYWNHPLTELAGKTMGIIGFGRIGRQTGIIASTFGMRVLVSDTMRNRELPDGNFHWAELSELLSESDVVSLHCPLTPLTREIINKDTLSLMKRTAYLINTSRGPLINEDALAGALKSGLIAGAGLDVLSVEPPPSGNPLLSIENCRITPHISWATKEARKRLLDTAVENLRSFLGGKPVNVVNSPG